MIEVQRITAEQALSHDHLTFPALRFPLLEPEGKDLEILAATDQEENAVGLAFGWGGPNAAFELISLYVSPLFRRHGLGSSLLLAVESGFAERGYTLGVHHFTLPEKDQGYARFLMGRGWSRPRVKEMLCKADLQGLLSTVWGSVRTPGRVTLVPWCTLDDDQRAAIRECKEREPAWYPSDQDPFIYEPGCHEPTSVALILENRVRGWLITHLREGGDSLRWTVSFVSPELARAGYILFLWREAAVRQRDSTSLKYLTWGVPTAHPRMMRVVRKSIRPHLLWTGYSCTSFKSLEADSGTKNSA
jgi:GNAT superfamily N-acetyltransferase